MRIAQKEIASKENAPAPHIGSGPVEVRHGNEAGEVAARVARLARLLVVLRVPRRGEQA